jgi:hypothetical protein
VGGSSTSVQLHRTYGALVARTVRVGMTRDEYKAACLVLLAESVSGLFSYTPCPYKTRARDMVGRSDIVVAARFNGTLRLYCERQGFVYQPDIMSS